MSKIIGIDLGTTNTVAAVVEGGEPHIIPTRDGRAMLRSVVAIAADGRWLVGQTAHNQAVANPANTAYAIKRLMGRQFEDEDVQELRSRNRYSQIVAGPDGRALVRLAGQDYRPEQIAAIILREVKTNAERYLGEEVRDAVISIPANAEAAQRQATLLAGEIAGLNVRHLIHEPTAIGLAYGVTNQRQGLIAVYDMGGGTFDVSFMQLREGELEVLRTAGRPFLGGDDFDHEIVKWITEEFERAHHIALNAPPEVDRYLRDTAESLKIALTTERSAPVRLPFVGGQYSLNLILSRDALEKRVEYLVQSSLDYCKFLRDELSLDRKDFDTVLLAGGMSRMPYIQQQVMTHFVQEPKLIKHPEQAVALGAALRGGILSGEIRDVLLLDITPLTLSLRKEGGLCEPFIRRNTTIPASEVKTVTTAEDDQTRMTIAVYQGERPVAEDNRLLGRFTLHDIPPAPRGVPQIEVTFRLDASGILTVSARDTATGRASSIHITEASGISETEVQQMIEATHRYAAIDRERTAAIEARLRRLEDQRRLAQQRFGTAQLDPNRLNPSVFLAYAHQDGLELARRLEADLSERRFTVFWDQGATPDEDELDVMEYAISQADVILTLMTSAATHTDYLKHGWQYAINRCYKPVIPLLAPGFDPTRLPPLLNNAQPVDLRGAYEPALDMLEQYLHTFRR